MKSQAQLWSACVVIATMFLSACAAGPSASTDVRQIVSTTSFGMCAGYCTTRLEISEGHAVLTREAHAGRGAPAQQPPQRIAAALSPSEWQEIAQLAANTNLTGLPPVIGCPDCADGGAESLTITTSSGSRSISFDHGAAVQQAQPLLDRVRALRTRMTPE